MIELIIRIVNNQPVDHPIVKENFLLAFPDLDFYQPGADFARFRRIPEPQIGVYEVLEGSEYRWNEDWIEDDWIVRPMTSEEKALKQQTAKNNWNEFSSWIFNEDTCQFESPIPYPDDGGDYIWDESAANWTLVSS